MRVTLYMVSQWQCAAVHVLLNLVLRIEKHSIVLLFEKKKCIYFM